MTTEEMIKAIDRWPDNLSFEEMDAIAAKLRAAEELASAWDAYDGLAGQLRMDKARDAYESAGDAK